MEGVPPDDLRCKRTDGRDWRCKRPSLPGKSYCDSHLHRSTSSKKPPVSDTFNSNSAPPLPNKPRVRIRVLIKPDPNSPLRAVSPDTARVLPPPLAPITEQPLAVMSRAVVSETTARDPVAVTPITEQPVALSSRAVSIPTARDQPLAVLSRAVVSDTEATARDAVTPIGEKPVAPSSRAVASVSETTARVGEGEFSARVVGKDTARVEGKGRRVSVAVPENLRCHRNDGRTWRCKKQVVEGQSFCEIHFNKIKIKGPTKPPVEVATDVAMPAPRVPRKYKKKVVVVSNGGGDVEMEERENDGGCGGVNMSDLVVGLEALRCRRDSGRGWRCENPVKKGYSLCESHLNKASIKRAEKPKGKIEKKVKVVREKAKGKGKKTEVVGVEGNVVAEGGVLPDYLRCTRNDGRDWRCKRRVLDGENMCEAHFKKIRLSDVEPKEGDKFTRKKRKKSKKSGKVLEVVIKQEPVFEEDNQLAMVADVAVAEGEREKEREREMEREKAKEREKEREEELRCKRTDGRGWRCKRRVVDGKTLCEIHFEQGKLRQKKISVPESLKLQKGESGERVEKSLKRKRALELLESNSDKGMKRMKAELIRVFLRREIIEQNKKSEKGSGSSNNVVGEVTRDLPYGLMAIPPVPPAQFLDNAGSLGIKVGVHCSTNGSVQRRFRSKNIEPPPISTLKAVSFAGNMGKVKNSGKKKCHWCRKSDKSSLTKCLSCKKRFFCSNCIKERCTGPEDVKLKCPVCRGSCDCKSCLTTRSKDKSAKCAKAIVKGKYKGSKFEQLEYLINLLLPILAQINQEQSVEVEMEAKFKGQNLSEVDVRQADVGCGDQCCCNNCKSPILDFHRSCPNCSYNLCLSCCREYSKGRCLIGTENCSSQSPNRTRTLLPGLKMCSEKIHVSSSTCGMGSADFAVTALESDSLPCLRISCPSQEDGGCGNSLLDLRCIFPLNWTKELEVSAKETASGHDFPQNEDDSLHCSSCLSVSHVATKNKELQEVSRRREPHDNFLYCPSSSGDPDMLAHFQKHWRMGHPVKVRNVLQCTSTLTWDPLAMFCSYLENGSSDCVNMKNTNEAANCSDWYEVEIGTKECFTPSLENGHRHIRHETLKVKAKLSSAFSRRLLEGHYSEIIHSLPLQVYTNPRSGLLNIAGKLPEDYPDSVLGPHICISLGSREEVARGELLSKLQCNSHDVVCILVHVGDTACSKEQLDKIKKLIKRNNTKNKGDRLLQNLENGEIRMHSDISVEAGEQDKFLDGTTLTLGITGASCCSAATNNVSAVNLRDDKSPAKLQSSDTDSDASMICSGTSDSPYKSTDQMSHLERLGSSNLIDKRTSDPCGAQWDIFRRQDIPKLLEYITKHVDELSFSYDFPKKVVHPIFDGSFYLDATHKMQLKEEFDIEPWTFNQCLGEAVFIPAGCPYQMRNFKSCVNVTVGFVSPENASECIKLINEIRVLPTNHKAKQVKLEVEKMTICSIDEAIKEIYRLRSEEKMHPDKGPLMPVANS